jgi:hypothetical protein
MSKKKPRLKQTGAARTVSKPVKVSKDLSTYLTKAAKTKIRKTINSLAYLGIYDKAKAQKGQSSDVSSIRIIKPDDDSGIKKLINPRKRRKGK